MSAPQFLNAPASFEWKLWPETEEAVLGWTAQALNGHRFAADLARRMQAETGTRFADWLDHLVLSERPGLSERLAKLGYEPQLQGYGVNAPAYHHPGGIFPRIAVVPNLGPGSEVREAAIKVESIPLFSQAHQLGLEILGAPFGPYRCARIKGEQTSLSVVERRGYNGFEAFPGDLARQGRMAPQSARDALAARDLWQARRRRFDEDEEGFDVAERTARQAIDRAGSVDLACHLIFEVERDYWQSRNRAARVQKERQDRLGLGWANHDHHTFRCSRRFFPRVMGLFKMLGFQVRERFHAGEHAGWGAQVLDHPTTGIVIFADLDLTPEEADADFVKTGLPDLPRPNTVGLWVALHGESILEAGMHHLEAQFEFDDLRDGLKAEAGIEMMRPFSDLPFLRQAFTVGEVWRVHPHRLDRCLAQGWISPQEQAKFAQQGAIGSHLENLQRREGYKGFNKRAVGLVIADTDPRAQ